MLRKRCREYLDTSLESRIDVVSALDDKLVLKVLVRAADEGGGVDFGEDEFAVNLEPRSVHLCSMSRHVQACPLLSARPFEIRPPSSTISMFSVAEMSRGPATAEALMFSDMLRADLPVTVVAWRQGTAGRCRSMPEKRRLGIGR